jgi:hypothetical protein
VSLLTGPDFSNCAAPGFGPRATSRRHSTFDSCWIHERNTSIFGSETTGPVRAYARCRTARASGRCKRLEELAVGNR